MNAFPDLVLSKRRRRLGHSHKQAASIMDRLKVDNTEMAPVGTTTSTSPRHRKITFARLATCILNVERARKRSSRAREEELLQASETGDVQKLRSLLQNRDVNMDCSDQLGRTPLLLAVVNEHKDAVRMLLDHVDKHRVYQALLSAINLGNEEIAEIIIEHPKYEAISIDLKEHGKAHCYLHRLNDDNQFSDVITPLILAAQLNRFEVVMALLLKGETIAKPHKCHCACSTCVAQAERDELKFAKSRLDAYKALASEAYISLSSQDPILTSFHLRKTLKQVAKEEKYYTNEYTSLTNKLSEYVVRLLDKVHGNEELNAILNAADDDSEADKHLTRLQLAIKYKEKKFVAHPSCQKKMTSLWYKDLHQIPKYRSSMFQVPIIILIIVLYPALAIGYLLMPNTWLGRLLRTPCIKFIAQSSSYMVFLGMILMHGQVEQGKLCTSKFKDIAGVSQHLHILHQYNNLTGVLLHLDEMCIRNYRPAGMELSIVLWIVGLVWQAIVQLYTVGGHTHFVNIYHAVDFFIMKFYIASLTLRSVVDFKIRDSMDYFKHEQSLIKLLQGNKEAERNVYWLNADRFYWNAWDPVHVAECSFAGGHILNFARIFHLLAINEHLGPMLISLEKMLKDVMRFFLTFVPIMLAFMVGMYNIYWYYAPSVRGIVEADDHKIRTKGEEGFGSPEFTFRTIFWAVFGLKDARLVELDGYESRLTESVGYIVFAVYNWGAVIVFLNMLIAMMTRSFDRISTDQDIEWKFARSKLYMEFIRHGNTLPVPFNLLPTPKNFVNLMRSCYTWGRLLRPCVKKTSEQETGEIDEESPPFYCMNGNNLLIGKHYLGQCNSLEMKSPSHVNEEKPHDASHEPAPPVRRSQYQPITLQDPDTSSDPSEYKTVIKRVVRRYILEHLMASVVPNEGSQELETLKQQTHALQHDVGCLTPKIEEQSQNIQSQLRLLSKNVANMREQMNCILHICQGVQKSDLDKIPVAQTPCEGTIPRRDDKRGAKQGRLWTALSTSTLPSKPDDKDISSCNTDRTQNHISPCKEIQISPASPIAKPKSARLEYDPACRASEAGQYANSGGNGAPQCPSYAYSPVKILYKSTNEKISHTSLSTIDGTSSKGKAMDYISDSLESSNSSEHSQNSPGHLGSEIMWRRKIYQAPFQDVRITASDHKQDDYSPHTSQSLSPHLHSSSQEEHNVSASVFEEEIFPDSRNSLHPISQDIDTPSFKTIPTTPTKGCAQNAFTFTF